MPAARVCSACGGRPAAAPVGRLCSAPCASCACDVRGVLAALACCPLVGCYLALCRHIKNSEYDPSEAKLIYRMVRRALIAAIPCRGTAPMMPPKPQTMQVQPEISLLIFESGKARRGRA